MRIRVKKTSNSAYWYVNLIGEEFDAKRTSSLYSAIDTAHNRTLIPLKYHSYLGTGPSWLPDDVEVLNPDNETFIENLPRMEDF